MIGRKSIVSALTLVVLAYLAAPYVTLWRLAHALQTGDARTVEGIIDWNAVRQGLKQDVADGIVGLPEGDDDTPRKIASDDDTPRKISSDDAQPTPTARFATNTLPPFGASFMTGIAGNVIDREVTPSHVVKMVREFTSADDESIAGMISALGEVHAFFDGPTSFVMRLRCAGQDDDDPPLRVRLVLRGGSWRVVRVWVPQDLIERADSRT